MLRTLFTLTLLVAVGLMEVNKSYAQVASADPSAPVNPVVQWNRTLLAIVRTPGAQPATIHPTLTRKE